MSIELTITLTRKEAVERLWCDFIEKTKPDFEHSMSKLSCKELEDLLYQKRKSIFENYYIPDEGGECHG